jgi:hypothetical protein
MRQQDLLLVVHALGPVRPFLGPRKAGSNIAAKMAMIAMTTSSSISVNPAAPPGRFPPRRIRTSAPGQVDRKQLVFMTCGWQRCSRQKTAPALNTAPRASRSRRHHSVGLTEKG